MGPTSTVAIERPELEPGGLYRIAWIFYLVLAVGGALWLGLRNGTIPLELFVDRQTWWLDVLVGGAAGGALLLLWEAARRWTSSADALEQRVADVLGPLEPGEAASLAVLSGVAEELLFRGAMQQAWGWPVAAALFALLHTGPGREYRVWTAFAAVAGLLFAAVVLWRGNLLPAIEAHVLVNAVGLRRTAEAARAGRPEDRGRGEP